jgi:hypothetical protein
MAWILADITSLERFLSVSGGLGRVVIVARTVEATRGEETKLGRHLFVVVGQMRGADFAIWLCEGGRSDLLLRGWCSQYGVFVGAA